MNLGILAEFLLLKKLSSACAAVFDCEEPNSIEEGIQVIQNLDHDAIALVLRVLKSRLVTEGDRESSINDAYNFQSNLAGEVRKIDWEDLFMKGTMSSKVKLPLLDHGWFLTARSEAEPASPTKPLVALSASGTPKYAVDISIGYSRPNVFVALHVYSAEEKWTGRHSSGVYAKTKIATMALTSSDIPSKTVGARPWFYNKPDSEALHYFIACAKSSSNPLKACVECQQIKNKLEFSDSAVCDTCLGIIH